MRIDSRGWITTYGFDLLDREATRLYHDGGRVTRWFDTARRLTQVGDGTGDTQYKYDVANRQIGITYPTGLRLTYGFDPDGNRVTMDDLVGRTTYMYSTQSEVRLNCNPYGETTTILYDVLGREWHKTLATGITVSHLYSPTGQELVLENRSSDGAALAIYTATYDVIGNRTSVWELDDSRVTYVYDSSYHLISEHRIGTFAYDLEYDYDGAGNRLVERVSGVSTTYLYNAAQELVLVAPSSGGPTTLTWDANGNLESEITGTSNTMYRWDDEDRLIEVAGPEEVVRYVFSTDGYRQVRQEPASKFFVWDQENLVSEVNAALEPTVYYTQHLPGRWGGLVSQRRLGDRQWYTFDQFGNTRILLGDSDPVAVYTFSAFGNELASADLIMNPYRYQGKFGYYRDTESRLYVRMRYLVSIFSRWASRDPIGIATELYTYSRNSPRWSDPSGLDPSFTNKCTDAERSSLVPKLQAFVQ